MTERASESPPTSLEEFGEDEAARWEKVARQYDAPLRGFFAKRVRNQADVDDLVQAVFVQLMQRGRGQPIEHVHQYIFRVAANVLRDQHRRSQARRQDVHESYDESEHAVRSDLSPERVLLGREAVERMAAALEELPERTRDIFILRGIRLCKYEDIAEMLGLSKHTVLKHMSKAMKHLTRIL
jgi:RNA polymerase sigma-70 factor (ECF subfamily)